MVITREISVDVSEKNVFSAIVAKQFDNNSRFLKVTLTNLGEILNVAEASTVVINALRGDGNSKAFFGEANSDGTVTVPLTSWMLELDDDVQCDISIIDTEEQKLTTTTFVLSVEAASYGGTDISEDENYDLLVSLISDAKACVDAEAVRVVAENERISNENARKSAETTRQSNETTRKSNETTRKSNETARNTAEGARATAEIARADAESVRVSNETARKSNESTRVSSEQNRVSAETTRETNETNRKDAETNRVNAERGRVAAEETRVSAEKARQEAEATRNNKEQERITAETARNTAEGARATATEAAIENANTATESANSAATNATNAAQQVASALLAGGIIPLYDEDAQKNYSYQVKIKDGFPVLVMIEATVTTE